MTLRSAPHTRRSSPHTRGNERGTVFLLILGLVWSSGLATQYVASRFGYHPNLGPPLAHMPLTMMTPLRRSAVAILAVSAATLFARSSRWLVLPLVILAATVWAASAGPLYAPYRVFVWYAAYHRYATFSALLRAGWIVFACTSLVLSGGIIATRRGRTRRPTASHGSAEWATGEALETLSEKAETAFVLGRSDTGTLLRYAGDGHLLTVAPTRSGKGIGCVIPNLLTYQGSVIVPDVKGELYPITARHRQDALGQRVYALDPFRVLDTRCPGLPPQRHGFNPLDLINVRDDHAIDNARLIADMLVVGSPHGGELAFWDEEARSLLTGLILYVAAYNDTPPPEVSDRGVALMRPPIPRRTLCGVRQVLTDPPVLLNQHLAWMALQTQWVGGLVARAAARMAQKADRERSGVISCAQNHTHFLDSPRMQAVLDDQENVDFRELTTARVSVYCILPYERLDGYARWLRLMVACALMSVVASPTRPVRRVLFLLDEFEALGQLLSVQRAIALAGGFGAAFWLFLQDLAQLKGTYPEKWGTFLANVDVFQCFGTNDIETAEYVSRMAGDATITVESDSRSAGVSYGRSSASQEGNAITTSETARRLLLPDEVRRLPSDRQVLFVKGCAPILARRINYLHDDEFAGQADANPLYAVAA